MADLFIYGTLRDRDVCEKVLGRPVPITDLSPAFAQDFAILKVADVSYPCLLPHEGSKAHGALLSNLTQDDIAILDKFEGVNYHRVSVRVQCDDGFITSQYYRPNDALQTDGLWDLAQWQKDGKEAFLAQDFNHQGIRIPSYV